MYICLKTVTKNDNTEKAMKRATKKQQKQTKSTVPGVVGYIRVSTEEQAERGLSLDAQRRRIEQYCELYGLELVGIYEDAGASAANLDRDGLRAALAAIQAAGRHCGLIVAKLDRLTRSVVDAGELLTGALRGRRLVSVGEQIDTTTAAGMLVYNMLVSVAQWERETIAERTRAALQQKKARGESTGNAPFGYKKQVDARGRVKIVQERREHVILERMRELRAAGCGWTEIARTLREEKRKNRRGDYDRWTPAQVYNILKVTPSNDK